MKTFTIRLLMLLCVGLTACSPDKCQQVEQENRRWQQQAQAEQSLLQQADTRSERQQEAKSWWQSIAGLFAVAAAALLIAGTILGSAARHESEH
jgi:hypothetical protein